MNKTNPRLLILSYHFPPDGAIGGMRWAGFAKYLARLGWEVHIVTASASAAEKPIEGVHVHVHPRRRTLNDLYNSAAKRFKMSRSNTPPGSHEAITARAPREPRKDVPARPRKSSALRNAGRVLRGTAGAWLAFPDFGRGWVLTAARATRALLRKMKFEVVITSGPPHSAHLAGALATLGRSEPLWIDMRDPWSDAVLRFERDRITRFLIPRLERFVRKRARRAVVTTAEFASTLRLAAPYLAVSHLSNGVDFELLPAGKIAKAADGCVISYVGTLYGNRSLSVVFAAISELVRDQPALRKTLSFHIAGNIDGAHRPQLEAELASGDIADLVHLHGVVSRSAALDLLRGSHLALVLAQDQHLMIPAKLYESVALGVPTLVIAEETSAAACESKRIGAYAAAPDDVTGIRKVFEDALARRIPSTVTPTAQISHQELAAKLDQLFRARLQPDYAGVPVPAQ